MRCLALLLLLCAVIPAQLGQAEPGSPVSWESGRAGPDVLVSRDTGTVVAQVAVANLSRWPRREIVRTVLPFARGTYQDGDVLALAGRAVQVERLGATWPDGSWRHAVVHLPMTRFAGGEARRVLDITTGGPASVEPFRYSKAVASGAGAFRIGLHVDGTRITAQRWVEVQTGHLTRTWRAVAHGGGGSPFWIDVLLVARSGLDHARFWVQYGTSDESVTDLMWEVPGPIELAVTGPIVSVYHVAAKVRSSRTQGSTTLIDLGTHGRWAEGQSQCVSGVLLFRGGSDTKTLAAEAEIPLLACGIGWSGSGAFGPWGVVPEGTAPRDLAHARQMAVADYAQHTSDPWGRPVHGLSTKVSDTGAQHSFGTAKFTREAHGWPERLYSLERSILQEACRPSHRRNADGSPVTYSKRPKVELWQGLVDDRISRDMMGKTRTYNIFNDGRTSARGEVWSCRDGEHHDVNTPTYYALLTGDPWARIECDHLVELWSGEMRVGGATSPILNSAGAARKTGRTLQAGTLLYLVTGRQDIADRIAKRVEIVKRDWAGAGTSPVRPLVTRQPYGGNLDGKTPFWMPWQEALALPGLDAVDAVWGNATAVQMITDVGDTLMRFGIWRKPANEPWPDSVSRWGEVPQDGRWTGGKAVEWLAGGADPRVNKSLYHRYDAYLDAGWMGAGVAICLDRGIEPVKAKSVLQQLYAGANANTLEWICVRPKPTFGQ